MLLDAINSAINSKINSAAGVNSAAGIDATTRINSAAGINYAACSKRGLNLASGTIPTPTVGLHSSGASLCPYAELA